MSGERTYASPQTAAILMALIAFGATAVLLHSLLRALLPAVMVFAAVWVVSSRQARKRARSQPLA